MALPKRISVILADRLTELTDDTKNTDDEETNQHGDLFEEI